MLVYQRVNPGDAFIINQENIGKPTGKTSKEVKKNKVNPLLIRGRGQNMVVSITEQKSAPVAIKKHQPCQKNARVKPTCKMSN